MERLTLADGKYTVINDNGALTALRYGEPWRDLAGDNLLYCLFVELEMTRKERDALRSAAIGLLADKYLHDPINNERMAATRAAVAMNFKED